MIRKLTRQGDALCLVIDEPLRERLGIDEGTPLRLSVEGRRLVIEPLGEAERAARFREALAETNREYGKALKRLGE